MAVDLRLPFAIPSASRYARPAAPADLLPVVYGDFSAGGRTGPLPTVLVDTTNFIYVAAAHAVGSIDEVWVGETKQTIGGNPAVNVNNALEGLAAVATITFSAVQTAPVTWRGTGKQAGGTTIVNPVAQVRDLFLTYGGLAAADFDAAAEARAEARAAAQSFQTAWVINDHAESGNWLTEMLFNVHGAWRVDLNGALVIVVSDGYTHADAGGCAAHLVAARDVLDGDYGVEMHWDLDHLVNALDVDYLYHWANRGYSSTITTNVAATSKNAYGEFRKRAQLRGVRTTAHITSWAKALFDRQDFRTRVEGAQVRFTALGASGLHLVFGDKIGFSWPVFGPSRERGKPYANEVLLVIEVSRDATGGGRTAVVAIDAGGFVTDRIKYAKAVKFSGPSRFGGIGRSLEVMI